MSGASPFVITSSLITTSLMPEREGIVVHDLEERALEDGAETTGTCVAGQRLARDG